MAFGATDREPPASSGRRLLTAIRDDRRLVPLTAGLAALAALGSLFGEWFTIVIPMEGGPVQTFELRTGVGDSGSFGAAYVVGLVAMVALLSLLLFGPPGMRRAARVTGLALAGALFVVVAVCRATFESFVTGKYMFFVGPESRFTTIYGRGVTAAFVAVALAGLAFYLAGRFLPTGEVVVAGAATDAAGPDATGRVSAADRGEWAWRRSRSTRNGRDDADEELAEVTPLDLTVEPASPFARPEQTDER
jgi:hypothetical protein